MRISAQMFAQLLSDNMERKTAGTGVEALIRQYYADYSDATEIDGRYLDALNTVTDGGTYMDEDLDHVIAKVEEQLRSEGRQVRTPGLNVEDED